MWMFKFESPLTAILYTLGRKIYTPHNIIDPTGKVIWKFEQALLLTRVWKCTLSVPQWQQIYTSINMPLSVIAPFVQFHLTYSCDIIAAIQRVPTRCT